MQYSVSSPLYGVGKGFPEYDLPRREEIHCPWQGRFGGKVNLSKSSKHLSFGPGEARTSGEVIWSALVPDDALGGGAYGERRAGYTHLIYLSHPSFPRAWGGFPRVRLVSSKYRAPWAISPLADHKSVKPEQWRSIQTAPGWGPTRINFAESMMKRVLETWKATNGNYRRGLMDNPTELACFGSVLVWRGLPPASRLQAVTLRPPSIPANIQV